MGDRPTTYHREPKWWPGDSQAEWDRPRQRKRVSEMRIATLNVRTLYRSEAVDNKHLFINAKLKPGNRYQRAELTGRSLLTLRQLISYIYGAPSKARNANIVCVWTYVWQRWNSLFLFAAQCFNTESMQSGFLCHICV